MKPKVYDKNRYSLEQGVTLVEVLAAMAVVVLLLSIMLPALTKSREITRRTICRSNLGELSLAALLYSNDDSRGVLVAQLEPDDRNLSWIYPRYIHNISLLNCPSTVNRISGKPGIDPISGEPTLAELTFLAKDGKSRSGVSYMQTGWMGWRARNSTTIEIKGRTWEIPFTRKTVDNVNRYEHFWNAFSLKGTIPGPSQIWIFNDNNYADHIHFPDRLDNHGSLGGNIAFVDGHVEWVSKNKYVYSYELSQDDNREAIVFNY